MKMHYKKFHVYNPIADRQFSYNPMGLYTRHRKVSRWGSISWDCVYMYVCRIVFSSVPYVTLFCSLMFCWLNLGCNRRNDVRLLQVLCDSVNVGTCHVLFCNVRFLFGLVWTPLVLRLKQPGWCCMHNNDTEQGRILGMGHKLRWHLEGFPAPPPPPLVRFFADPPPFITSML